VLTQISRRLGRIELKVHVPIVCILCIHVKGTFLKANDPRNRPPRSEATRAPASTAGGRSGSRGG
jgi:hypothetical protein